MFGEDHIQTASAYQHLAGSHYRSADFKKAFEVQQKAHNILKTLFGDNN